VSIATANETRRRARRAGIQRFLLLLTVGAGLLAIGDWFTGGVTRGWVHGKARLTVATEPAGASVTIDGSPRGQSPLTLAVAPGEHTLLVRHPYHPAHLEQLELARDQHVERRIVLAPAYGALLIASNPKGARVTLNGIEQTGTTPLLLDPVLAGRHTITLHIPGRTTGRVTAEVLPGTRAEVTAELERIRPGLSDR
jgi:hypothetical protein